MGIKRLFSFLKPLFEDKELKDFRGKKIGIDGMAWIYQSFFCNYDTSDGGFMGFVRQVDQKIKLMRDNKLKVR